MKSLLWKIFYGSWGKIPVIKVPGYTILIMVPGDLPVFLQVAVENCALQKADYLTEILIISDKIQPGFPDFLNDLKNQYPKIAFRIVKLKPLDWVITGYMNNPGHNHWLQCIRGVAEVNSTHAVMHDADMFINKRDLFESQYKICVSRQLACLGVSKVWDAWYQQQGINHLTATWELMFNVDWFRSFKPYQHHGQENFFAGKRHVFDTTLLPQCLTAPEKISYIDNDLNLVHFNYLISTYRFFQNTKGPFEDSDYRILLIRLLIDAFDSSGWLYDIPSLNELADGIKNGTRRVTYIREDTKNNYSEFRYKLQKLINNGFLEDKRKSAIQNEINYFDIEFKGAVFKNP